MKKIDVFFGLVVVCWLVGMVIGSHILFARVTVDDVVILVKDKERVTVGEGSKYLVFTEGEVFEDSDCLAYMKYNSSDLYGELERGCRYKAKVYGIRVSFLSWYRNIVSIERVVELERGDSR